MNIISALKESENEEKVCCVCGEKYKGWGNDAWPICDGYCCDKCNAEKVIPARLAQAYGIKNESSLDELEDFEPNNYKKFNHVNDVWEYLEDSKSKDDLDNRISEIDPKEFGSIYYDLHKDGNGATVIIDYQSDNEDYYEKVDIYFDEE